MQVVGSIRPTLNANTEHAYSYINYPR